MTALGLMGSPYRYGGQDPRGFDCSGLVNYVFRMAAGAALPRSADEQAAASRYISRRELREGDLVFFNTLGRPNSHVGIYIGDGRFVNAPSSGGRVRVDSLNNPYFAKRFNSARTLFASR
ncbi:MAG TPA: C40 family peptidase [Burkholderiaceae bacterium]|nr:C40 family peptidase [Burkholderiaceae bacterium]